jgi:hypothetical protein
MENGTEVIVIEYTQGRPVLWEGIYRNDNGIVTVTCTKSFVHYVQVGQVTMPSGRVGVMRKTLSIVEC